MQKSTTAIANIIIHFNILNIFIIVLYQNFINIASIFNKNQGLKFLFFLAKLIDKWIFGYYNSVKGQRKSNFKKEGLLWQVEVI